MKLPKGFVAIICLEYSITGNPSMCIGVDVQTIFVGRHPYQGHSLALFGASVRDLVHLVLDLGEKLREAGVGLTAGRDQELLGRSGRHGGRHGE